MALNLAAGCQDKRLKSANCPDSQRAGHAIFCLAIRRRGRRWPLALSSTVARAETGSEPPVACASTGCECPPKLIESCTALIDNPATPDADRLNAMIVRRGRATDSRPDRPRRSPNSMRVPPAISIGAAFRARGEILRRSGKTVEAFEALNQAIRLEPDNAEGYESARQRLQQRQANTTARSRTITRRCGSSPILRWPMPIAARPGISRASIRRRLRTTIRPSSSIRTGRRPIPTAARPIASSATSSGRSTMRPRRSGSIRRSRNSSTIAGSISPAMAITPARSPTTTRRSSFAPRRNF